jgi:photosystem II stability/assembly factor-like uncharacterized protein
MKVPFIPKESRFNSFKSIICIITVFVLSLPLHSQWIRQNSGISYQLLSVYFINQTTGFAGGVHGQILKTTDSGVSWQANTVIDTSAAFCSFYFLNPSTGYSAGRILILGQTLVAKPLTLKTTDSGGTWNSLLNDSGYTLWSIYFINENTGFATGGLYSLGSNNFLSTTDGGLNWQISSFAPTGYLQSVSFQNVNTGYVVNLFGYIYKSTNSGINWSSISLLPHYLFSAAFNNSDVGYATGGDLADSSGVIYKTTNGGNNWDVKYSDNLGLINWVTFVNTNTGFALGQREYSFGSFSARIIKTTDTGNSWYIDTLFGNVGGLTSLFFTDENTGYAVGSEGAIFKTTTGGNFVGIQNNSGEVPIAFSLYQNYPNPFNPSTKISYDLPSEANVKLTVYDDLGREVKSLVNEKQNAGKYEIVFNALNLPSGVYYYKLETGGSSGSGFTQTKKMVLIK